MKTSTKKKSFTFLFLATLLISLIFTSCSDKNQEAYNKEIKTADALFKKQQFNEAKTYYLKASQLKKDETYPKNQISKINTILSEINDKKTKEDTKNKEAVTTTKKSEIKNKKPYVVVVASYAITSNAKAHQKKLNSKGYNTTIVKSDAGNHLIGLQTFKTLTASYNYLESLDISDDYYINEIWVYKIK